eukprot:TRINITY_DN2557_c0_g1_i1.p1 TRINITY_DN2557_c0_g1~~TRINITY_DN2557_c0_g1_i1.p1  ORF type:complete len:232 (-),score=44.20 TRINITY_DN2557_c0_g1_i1:519-1214(-)
MSSALDMSLDDLIKKNKRTGSRGRGRRGSDGTEANGNPLNPVGRRFKRATNRAPNSFSKPNFDTEMLNAVAPSKPMKIETGTKVAISNLDYGVSNDDIRELFSEVGDLKRYAIHYDRSGRSKGTGEVVFARRSDADTAVKRYNNVQLDGKPLKLEIIGTNLAVPAPANPQTRAWSVRAPFQQVARGRGRREGGRGSRGGGRGRQRKPSETKTAEDLDAELENYHANAMQTD